MNREREGEAESKDKKTKLENCIPFIFYTIQFTRGNRVGAEKGDSQ